MMKTTANPAPLSSSGSLSGSSPRSSSVSLSLQSLIDTRYNILKSRSDAEVYGNDYPGQRTGIKRGQGMEFIDLRQYTAGDDVRHIDWNVTARSNEPYTRLYRQEKEQTTTTVVDLRPIMFNGSQCLRSTAAAIYAATTLWQAEHSGDRCAAIVIDNLGVRACRPMTGSKGVLQSLELIISAYEQSAVQVKNSLQPEPLLSEALQLINTNKRSAGSYVVFSGFDAHNDHTLKDLLASVAARGRTYAVLLLDKLEHSAIPTGHYRYQSKKSNAKSGKVTLNKQNVEQLGALLQQQIVKRQGLLHNAGIETITQITTTASTDLLTKMQRHRWI